MGDGSKHTVLPLGPLGLRLGLDHRDEDPHVGHQQRVGLPGLAEAALELQQPARAGRDLGGLRLLQHRLLRLEVAQGGLCLRPRNDRGRAPFVGEKTPQFGC